MVLPMLRRIANAESSEEYIQSVNDLKQHHLWKVNNADKFRRDIEIT